MRTHLHFIARFLILCLCTLTYVSVAHAQTIEYLHTDILGSPVLRTGNGGAVTADFRYSAYGSVLTSSGSVASIGYTGAPRDTESGFVYLQKRYYDPRIGRFLAVDPLSFRVDDPQSFNLYAYSNNNPLRYTDPDGRSVLSLMDWKDFGQDVGQLLVDEIVYAIAVTHGNDAVAQMAIEAMMEHRLAAATSTAGVLSPVPRSGQVIKRAGDAMSMADDAASVVNKAIDVAGGVSKGAEVARKAWTITKEGTERVVRHKQFGTFPKSKSDGLWWSKDRAGHGGSKWKVFKETKDGLEWRADADEFGNFIQNKHKSEVGQFIPWSKLGSGR